VNQACYTVTIHAHANKAKITVCFLNSIYDIEFVKFLFSYISFVIVYDARYPAISKDSILSLLIGYNKQR